MGVPARTTLGSDREHRVRRGVVEVGERREHDESATATSGGSSTSAEIARAAIRRASGIGITVPMCRCSRRPRPSSSPRPCCRSCSDRLSCGRRGGSCCCVPARRQLPRDPFALSNPENAAENSAAPTGNDSASVRVSRKAQRSQERAARANPGGSSWELRVAQAGSSGRLGQGTPDPKRASQRPSARVRSRGRGPRPGCG
jgi:hypothetical protein